MVYRFHFTGEDLARTRVADSVPPLSELGIALRVLQDRSDSVRFGAWRPEVRAGLSHRSRMLLELVPRHGWSPGFLFPHRTGDVGEILETVAATPRRQLRSALGQLAERQPLPRWCRGLGEDPEVLRHLVDALRDAHALAVAPYWPSITTLISAELNVRSRQLLNGGVEALLSGLYPPRIRWRAPILEVDLISGLEGDVHLEGRGLLLIPSAFAFRVPLVDPDNRPQPALTFPAVRPEADPGPLTAVRQRTGAGALTALSALLGSTRAAILSTIADHPGCSTSGLAALAGVGLSGASQHASILRDAGLISTVRYRNTALHTVTSAGVALLQAS